MTHPLVQEVGHQVRIDFEGLADEENQRLAAGMMCEIKVKVE